MTVGSDHHRDLDALRTKPGDAPSPFSFDQRSPFQPKAKLGEELNGGIDVFHHDADVIHTTNRHAASLTSYVRVGQRAAHVSELALLASRVCPNITVRCN